MKTIEIYTTQTCGYCMRAKRLLSEKGLSYTEIDVAGDAEKRLAMTQRANGGRTVPQIFIDDQHIGGCDELYALDRMGKLDQLLAA